MRIIGSATSKDNNFSSAVLWTVVLLLVLGGCRSYGGYGSEEANLEQIQQLNLTFTEQLTSIERSLEDLRQLAAAREDLQPHLERYEEAVQLHEEMVEEHAVFAERAEENRGDHRALHRLFRAIVVDHSRMRDHYDRLLQNLYGTASPDEAAARTVTTRDRGYYQVAPPYHQRIERVEPDLSLSDVLDQLSSAAE